MDRSNTGDVAGEWSGSQDPHAPDMDDVSEGWIHDLDLTLEPAPQRAAAPTAQRRSGARRGLVLLATGGLLAALSAGAALVALLAALVVAGAVLVWPVASSSDAPLDEVGFEMVTPVIVDVPATVVPIEVEAPKQSAPRKPAAPKKPAPKQAASAPASDGDEAQAKPVVMPDPAFRGIPAEQAIERLKNKVENGEASAVVGR